MKHYTGITSFSMLRSIVAILCCSFLFNLVSLQVSYAVEPLTNQQAPIEENKTTTEAEPEEELTMFNMVLFYAGIMGALIGAMSGWVFWLAKPAGPKQSKPESKK